MAIRSEVWSLLRARRFLSSYTVDLPLALYNHVIPNSRTIAESVNQQRIVYPLMLMVQSPTSYLVALQCMLSCLGNFGESKMNPARSAARDGIVALPYRPYTDLGALWP